jgi:hypothetical protein
MRGVMLNVFIPMVVLLVSLITLAILTFTQTEVGTLNLDVLSTPAPTGVPLSSLRLLSALPPNFLEDAAAT